MASARINSGIPLPVACTHPPFKSIPLSLKRPVEGFLQTRISGIETGFAVMRM